MQVGTQLYIYQQRSQQEFGRPFEEALDQIFAQVRAAGYAGVELPLALVGTPERAQRVGELLTRHELDLPSVYAGGPLHDAAGDDTVWDVLEQLAEAKLLGVRALTFNPAPERERAKTDQELAAQTRLLDHLGSQLQGRNVQLALHFHAPELRDGGRELWADLDRTNPANVGLCLDADWAWRGGVEPLRLLERYGERVVSLHLRDASGGTWAQALGEGGHAYGPLIERLRALQFADWANVELAYEEGMVWTRSVEENLRRSRAWVQQQFGA